MVQAVEGLLSKHEALSANPSTTKKKKEVGLMPGYHLLPFST
jgi:hypothetical protein